MERMTWDQICRRQECRGRWVALHGCRYDEHTGKACEGEVIAIDDDLATLCERVTDSELRNIAIQYCG